MENGEKEEEKGLKYSTRKKCRKRKITKRKKRRNRTERGRPATSGQFKIRTLTVPAGHWCHVDVFDNDNT